MVAGFQVSINGRFWVSTEAATTDAYTLVNGAFGIRWASERLVTSIKVTNLANQEVLQHIFGDVLKRQVVGEARVTF